MARTRRHAPGGAIYHVLNRAARKAALFWTEQDYGAFLHVVAEARTRFRVRIFAYIVMPNHWHFLVQPLADKELSRFMHWLGTTHTRRWNIAHQKCGEGAVYQSRFKAIPVQDDVHLRQVWRYIERNALRANLVSRAEDWFWSSLRSRGIDSLVDPPPVPLPPDWIEVVNQPQTDAEVEAIRDATEREIPYGEASWRAAIDASTDATRPAKERPLRFGRHLQKL